jgi:hypothetical protein
MNWLLIAVALAAPAVAPAQSYLDVRPPAAPGHVYPELKCSNRGVLHGVGETACIRTNCCPVTGCETFTARCGLSTNVTVWRRVREGCDPALTRREAPPSSAPAARG